MLLERLPHTSPPLPSVPNRRHSYLRCALAPPAGWPPGQSLFRWLECGMGSVVARCAGSAAERWDAAWAIPTC